MKILAINGSPRRKGNTSLMLAELRRGAEEAGAIYEEIIADQLDLEYCSGCLRCNLIKRCSIKKDDWPNLSEKILNADALVFGTPIYFHHFTAPLKKVLDRFRSFMHVQMTETGLIHTPWQRWQKHFVLVSSLGHQTTEDAQPVVDLMKFMINLLGKTNQVAMSQDQLREFYQKIKMPEHLAEPHFQRNQQILKSCYQLGKKIGASSSQ
jgi:multimeric flavodoxin WrbA